MRAKSFQTEDTMESDRKRIASDLHDDLGSLLTGLRLNLRELSRNDPTNSVLMLTSEALDSTIVRMREVSMNLVPRELEKEGIHEAVESLVERLNGSRQFVVVYHGMFSDADFDIQKSLLLFRAIQELITNSIKHSGGNRIELAIAERQSMLIIEMRDNGRGFDYAASLKKPGSSGLKNVRSRLDLLNGVMDVKSASRSGSHFFISIPLKQLIKHG